MSNTCQLDPWLKSYMSTRKLHDNHVHHCAGRLVIIVAAWRRNTTKLTQFFFSSVRRRPTSFSALYCKKISLHPPIFVSSFPYFNGTGPSRVRLYPQFDGMIKPGSTLQCGYFFIQCIAISCHILSYRIELH